MLHSMTGFARESLNTTLGVLTWELKAVNHRYLDLQFRLPEVLRAGEARFRQQAGERLRRGKIDCGLSFCQTDALHSTLELDRELVRALSSQLEELRRLSQDYGAVNPVDILRWPGVVRTRELDIDALSSDAAALFGRALEALAAMRRSEGKRLHAMLETRCGDILRVAGGIRAGLPALMAAVRERQRERLAQLAVEADPARLETELALIAQKLDVDEELDRLESHVTEIRSVLARDEAVGRRLDFLMQELNREANTLAAKAANTATTRAAVELKVLIEQMREQVQNVE